ncbi:MAG: flagellar brake protein [Deltaproteobacteria bacterium]|nr:flagellar brake protein [Deltaproteobacteria bacterium]
MSEETKLNFQHHYHIGIQRSESMEDRRTGVLMGLLGTDHLLLSGDGCAGLKPGEKIIVRTVHGGRAFGFETVVAEVPTSGTPLAVVEIPSKIESLGLRKSDRINVLIPVDIRTQGLGENSADTLLLRGTILNLSSGGVRLYTKTRVGKDATMALSFTLPGAKNIVTISGVVLDSFLERSVFGQRVKFFNTEKNQAELISIKQWVVQHLMFAEA